MFQFTELDLTEQFDDSFRRLPERVQKQCRKALGYLLTNPDHPSLNLKPILPAKIYWEARLNRSDRLVLRPDGSILRVLDVVTHDEIARWSG